METNSENALGNEDFISSKKTIVSFVKYIELSDDDNEFLLSLVQQTLIEFQVFKQKYPELIEIRDEQNLSSLVHKIKPTLILLDLTGLMNDIQENREMLKSGLDIVEIKPMLSKIIATLELIIKEIENKIEELIINNECEN